VADQMGHNDTGELWMTVYASAVRRRERLTGRDAEGVRSGARLGEVWAANGPRAHYFTE
jgi:hypothetical protein